MTNNEISGAVSNTMKAINKAKSELTVKPVAEMPVATGMQSADWGAIENLETTDLLVPKIYHQQAMSQLVRDGVARPGDFCDSITNEVIAEKNQKLELIIFGVYKTLIVSALDTYSNKFKTKEIITVTPANAADLAARAYTEELNGVPHKNALYYNFYCLLPSRMDGLPFVFSMGSTKTKTAKKICAMLYEISQQKKPGASVVFELKSVEQKNDQGAWFGLDVTRGRDSTPTELLRAYAWYTKSKSQKFVASEDTDDTDVPF